MKNILVTGGCGYIGSHMVKWLIDQSYEVVVLDNLSTGYKDACGFAKFVQGDLCDEKILNSIFESRKFHGVIHFAGSSQVSESMKNPIKYFENNFVNSLNLVKAMSRHNVKNIVFSSSAAVYGNSTNNCISESHPCDPVNPYGMSKLMIERFLQSSCAPLGIVWTSLRYFNAAGAHPDASIGERHDPETHLIPLALRSAMTSGDAMKIFGDDYQTRDGTCIRDYVHVCDLVQAHGLALEYQSNFGRSGCFNLGSSTGHTVKEIIQAVSRVVGKPVEFEIAPKRQGDPPVLVASNTKAKEILKWTPQFIDIHETISHAYEWEKRRLRLLGQKD